eukprot:scaffold20265_cov55-Phaeocystis_antarctica.AAC.4
MRIVALLLRLACAYGMAASSLNRAKLPGTPVSLAEVLSTCVDAASRGCAEISAVQSRRDAGGELSVAMKDQADVRSALTEADLAAQRAMIGALRSAWPGLMIIGEEDEDDADDAADDVTSPPLRRDLCAELGVPGLEAPLEELCVFVDPLDGTREFVEGRLANVQSLVGVARPNPTPTPNPNPNPTPEPNPHPNPHPHLSPSPSPFTLTLTPTLTLTLTRWASRGVAAPWRGPSACRLRSQAPSRSSCTAWWGRARAHAACGRKRRPRAARLGRWWRPATRRMRAWPRRVRRRSRAEARRTLSNPNPNPKTNPNPNPNQARRTLWAARGTSC